ncbi:TPA: DUF2513 domain-containing protein [Pseudomonas aeruginosa]|uniref:DUF2513 domain-containing protein n=1 Tax=Pseudomonas aeruginosa group TaxID=136841 RepID=UPI00070E9476|nr:MULTISPECIES: DUF2513 domain-containing protein [Pseudomonas aeruginosa group]EMB4117873.1 DUF2513 domain-containing protein [Pseudomonas aeruginosa]MDI3608141.1 DUF2513 domain-containing protein [Pseudomonas aeruginosa]MDI3674894.1 DUF2513 domain-containing protein [Pseudomonas aeruginosa]MDI3705436.1 DUF2513 domain-containing protein [Pseudomonas aeruginosa]MDI3759526.1 DUF2513 domain-containing protein [Pseudomonas aeruginosa]
MRRNWDVIRDVLIEVESLDPAKFESINYGPNESEDSNKGAHAVLLWRAGFVQGVDASSSDGDEIIAQGLTWAGYDLLDTIRSKAVWERIKSTAQDKGIELTFDAVKALGKYALDWVISN